MLVWWRVTSKLPWQGFRYLLRITIGVFLVVPWYTDDTSSYLSPAWIVSLLDGVFEGPDAFWRAGKPLLAAVLVASIVSVIVYMLFWLRVKKWNNS